MIIIHENNSFVNKLTKVNLEQNCSYKWSIFVLLVDTQYGTLLLNTITNELFLIETSVLHDNINSQTNKFENLQSKTIIVPADLDEYSRIIQIRSIISKTKKTNLNSYNILTTLGCNAKCTYCFESRMPKISMNEGTAFETIKFIQKTSKGEKIKLRWFGGEPLVNIKIIDLISAELNKLGIEFKSDIISNGYLFDEEIINRVVDLWNIKKIQITLDGTEKVYNRTKAYINAEESAYKRVIRNIGLLSDAGIKVNIRLNLSLENSENLLLLADELASFFAVKENISVYVMPLYEYFKTDDSYTIHTIFNEYKKLVIKLIDLRLYKAKKLPESLPLNHCMADNDNAYTILPNGKIGKCEHFCDSHFVGDIWNGITDKETVEWFKQRVPEEEKCKTCVFAPSCTLLSACSIKCNELYRLKMRFDLEQSMLAAYRKWKEENKEKENETEPRI